MLVMLLMGLRRQQVSFPQAAVPLLLLRPKQLGSPKDLLVGPHATRQTPTLLKILHTAAFRAPRRGPLQRLPAMQAALPILPMSVSLLALSRRAAEQVSSLQEVLGSRFRAMELRSLLPRTQPACKMSRPEVKRG